MSYYGCPSRGIWIGGTILFFLTTVTFLTLFILQKFKPSLLLGPYGFKQPCVQQTDCIEGLTCAIDPNTGEGQCLCTTQTAPTNVPENGPPTYVETDEQ